MFKPALCVYTRALSKRYPFKYKHCLIDGRPMLEYLLASALSFFPPDCIYVLTGDTSECDDITFIANKMGVRYFRGSEKFPILRTSQFISTNPSYTHVVRIC